MAMAANQAQSADPGASPVAPPCPAGLNSDVAHVEEEAHAEPKSYDAQVSLQRLGEDGAEHDALDEDDEADATSKYGPRARSKRHARKTKRSTRGARASRPHCGGSQRSTPASGTTKRRWPRTPRLPREIC